MFDETLASRVARLEEAHASAKDSYEATGSQHDRDLMNVRKLALLKVEHALVTANF